VVDKPDLNPDSVKPTARMNKKKTLER